MVISPKAGSGTQLVSAAWLRPVVLTNAIRVCSCQAPCLVSEDPTGMRHAIQACSCARETCLVSASTYPIDVQLQLKVFTKAVVTVLLGGGYSYETKWESLKEIWLATDSAYCIYFYSSARLPQINPIRSRSNIDTIYFL
ncbi:hypothetical protein EV426DRAFT_583675, partial [Tirmania nivea]